MFRKFTPDQLDDYIKQKENDIERLKKIKTEVQSVTFFEVGIDRQSHDLVTIQPQLGTNMELTVRVVYITGSSTRMGGSDRNITIQEFLDQFVEYSPKMRSLLPEKD